MWHTPAHLEANRDRFIEHATESGQAWILGHDAGKVFQVDSRSGTRKVILIWSMEVFARRAMRNLDDTEGWAPRKLELAKLLGAFLPRAAKHGLLVGPNFTSDLKGVELGAEDLGRALRAAAPDDPTAG